MSTSLDRERMTNWGFYTNNQSSAGKNQSDVSKHLEWAVEEPENPDKGKDKARSSSNALQVAGQE